MRFKKLVVAVLLSAALGAGVLVNSVMTTSGEVSTATLLPIHNALPKLDLIDHDSRPVTADTFRGRWDLLFFGFTNCPDICPVTLQILATSVRRLQESGAETLPRIVFVSVDPERDTPEQLGQYLAHFGNDYLGVTGDLENIRTLTSALHIYFEKQTVDGDNYGVDHSAAVLVINPDGEFHAVFGAPHDVANYVHDLPIIMADRN